MEKKNNSPRMLAKRLRGSSWLRMIWNKNYAHWGAFGQGVTYNTPPSSVLVSSISYLAKTKSKNCFIAFQIFATSKIDQHVMVPSSYKIAPSSAILASPQTSFGVRLSRIHFSPLWSSCDNLLTKWIAWLCFSVHGLLRNPLEIRNG